MNILEIAKRAGVSRATVSRVINDVPTVDPKLAKRVRAVVTELGYKPNFQAQSLARGRTSTVGLIVSEISGGNPFFAELILAFERAASQAGFEVLINFAEIETNPQHLLTCMDRLAERRVEGIAVLTFGMEEVLSEKLSKLDIPLVFAGANLPAATSNLKMNYLTGMREAVRHLKEFGHRRIGYLSGNLMFSCMHTRFQALKKAMRLEDIAFDEDLVSRCDHSLMGGADGMYRLLNLPSPPTAVMCCNDMAALGALKTLRTRGLEPALDVSLIGLDNLSVCQFVEPSLTTIHFSPLEIARLAFETLLWRMRQTATPSQEYKTHLVLRESTGPVSDSVHTIRRATSPRRSASSPELPQPIPQEP